MIRHYGEWAEISAPSNYALWFIQWSAEDTKDTERVIAVSYWKARGKVDTLEIALYLKGLEGIMPIALSKDFTLFPNKKQTSNV